MAGHVGRFAPSPTGPLHAGSVVAALGSFLDARAAGGQWRLRIDDIDPPRQSADAPAEILRQLEALGFEWDGPVLYQSTRLDAYDDAFADLRQRGLVYRCDCSRRQLAKSAATGPLGRVYPGHCRNRELTGRTDVAWRLRLPDTELALDDRTQGRHACDPVRDLGDPVIRRRDGLWSYHLATTLDDAFLDVTHVVRGADLLPCALVQIALQRMLGLAEPDWQHLPVLVDANGDKLSKQTGARSIDPDDPVRELLRAWRTLGQRPPPARPGSAAEFHRFAASHWCADRVPAGPVRLPAGIT